MDYEVRQSEQIRGVAIVSPGDMRPQSRVTKLCEAFSGGKYSTREHGYRMSTVTLKRFMTATRLGCTSPDGVTIRWESPCGSKFYSFGAAHPERFLRSISREP